MGRASCIAVVSKAALKLAVPALSLALALSHYRMYARRTEAELSPFPSARKKGLRSMSFLRVISFCFPKPLQSALTHQVSMRSSVFAVCLAPTRRRNGFHSV